MRRLRSKPLRRWTTSIAVIGLLFQAGLFAWHATAMFDLASGHGDGHAQAAMSCHKAMGLQASEHTNGKTPAQQNCTCCLGLISVGAEIAVLDMPQPQHAADVASLSSHDTILGGRPLLAPDSRGPPASV